MADVHDKKTRSKNMSRIKGKDTLPELIVRRFLHSKGFRFRLHDKRLPGKPDIVLPKYKTIVQIHGCFWHGHKGCKFFVAPKTDVKRWKLKVEKTKEIDLRNEQKLKDLGWNLITVWADCELQPKRKTSEIREETLNNLIKELKIADTNN